MASFSKTYPLDQFLAGLENPGRGPGVTVEDRRDLAIVQVFAANGKTKAVEKALGIKESPGKATSSSSFSAVPLTPGQWMLVSAQPSPKDFANRIAKKLKSNGYVSEQSGGRVVLRISGPRVRELMQKGCRLDLHSSVTGKGWCAQTQMAQIGVIIHQVDDKPTYDLSVYSGFAREFAEWILHSATQYGITFRISG